ncbi:DUF4386 domain-containing protein [Edaphobacter aggregans]|uniref:DUF4386 domain-containing protein n=1 Tax=Edaphobacter aggregans TaxID=570835 RepID=UPI000557A756|nr:DUF4386 domain-containing protein [Edaphobacter aggregans]
MSSTHNPGRVAGVWYLFLCILGPLRLIYIPNKLFVSGNPTATVHNIAVHPWLFRFGIVADLICAVILIFLVLALYRLFKGVNQYLAVLVVILGGVMPSLLYFVNVVTDAGALMIARGADFLSVFDKPQQDALVVLLLHLHDYQVTAAEILWGAWLLPLGTLVYRSHFLPRFLGVWLVINGFAYILMSFTGILLPQYEQKLFLFAQPALFAELVFMLWILIRGARPPAPSATAAPLIAGESFN